MSDGPPPGSGRLAVVRRGCRSVVATAVATSPLRMLTPRNHGHAAWIYTSHHGGGFVDGDSVELRLEVGPGAAAFVSTQASTKIYRSPAGTCATLDARVAPDGLLVLVPDPVVPFAGSKHRQVQRFDIAAAGMLVLADALACGRSAAGERWSFAEYSSLTEIRLGGRLLVHDALRLRPEEGPLGRRFGRFDVVASVLVIGDGLLADAEALAAGIDAQPVCRRADVIATASRLGTDGCLIRLLATSVEGATRVLRGVLGFVPGRIGDDPWRRRW